MCRFRSSPGYTTMPRGKMGIKFVIKCLKICTKDKWNYELRIMNDEYLSLPIHNSPLPIHYSPLPLPHQQPRV
jgi:hypothetical protein